jgi:hypothetical protein
MGALVLLLGCTLLPAQGAEAARAAAGRPAPSQAGARPPAQRPATGRQPTRPGPSRSAPGSRTELEEILGRYAWIVPATTGGKATLGLLVFASLAGVIAIAGRIADVEYNEFRRSCAQALVVLALIAAHMTVALSSPEAMLVAALIDLVVWFVAARFLFGTGLSGGLIMLVSSALATLVGVLLLEVAALILDLTGAL